MKMPVVVVLLLLLTVALAGCSNVAVDQNNAGVRLSNDARWEEAIAEYDEAIRLDPQDADAYKNRGDAYIGLGEHQRAIQDYDEALRLDPQLAPGYNNRGSAYLGLGEPQRAIEDYDEALRVDPQYAIAYYNRGRAYGSLGKHQRVPSQHCTSETGSRVELYLTPYLRNSALSDHESAVSHQR